jgi:hypothetical protein
MKDTPETDTVEDDKPAFDAAHKSWAVKEAVDGTSKWQPFWVFPVQRHQRLMNCLDLFGALVRGALDIEWE